MRVASEHPITSSNILRNESAHESFKLQSQISEKPHIFSQEISPKTRKLSFMDLIYISALYNM